MDRTKGKADDVRLLKEPSPKHDPKEKETKDQRVNQISDYHLISEGRRTYRDCYEQERFTCAEKMSKAR